MRVALCDDDAPLLALVEDLLLGQGHAIIGVADTTVAAVRLVEHGRPDLVVVDPAVGCNTDFDVIATAFEVGAATVVFSRSLDFVTRAIYPEGPVVVAKPDLAALEVAISRLARDGNGRVTVADRRMRPARPAAGPAPTGVHDASAFYSALNEAVPGDSLVALLLADGLSPREAEATADAVTLRVRAGDRVLLTGWAVVALLPAAGQDGVAALTVRLRDIPGIAESQVSAAAVGTDETGPQTLLRLRGQT